MESALSKKPNNELVLIFAIEDKAIKKGSQKETKALFKFMKSSITLPCIYFPDDQYFSLLVKVSDQVVNAFKDDLVSITFSGKEYKVYCKSKKLQEIISKGKTLTPSKFE